MAGGGVGGEEERERERERKRERKEEEKRKEEKNRKGKIGFLADDGELSRLSVVAYSGISGLKLPLGRGEMQSYAPAIIRPRHVQRRSEVVP